MTGAQQPDALKRLVFFMIALAMLGAILALAGYFTADLTEQNTVRGPSPKNLALPDFDVCTVLGARVTSCYEDCNAKIRSGDYDDSDLLMCSYCIYFWQEWDLMCHSSITPITSLNPDDIIQQR